MTKASIVKTGNTGYRKTRMRNGLRVVTQTLPGVRSISLGIWVDVGSRSERADQAGLSHFVEHLVFKGTRSRNARQIAGSLESIGGSLNAFTTREHTCFTARVLDEHLEQAVDILADLTCRPTLTPTNIRREKTVICEEIRESLDNPADHIHDMFADTHWAGHALGRPIMGSEKNILEMPRARLVDFKNSYYRTGSVVVAASGAVSHDRLVKLLRAKFDMPEGTNVAPEMAARPNTRQANFQQEDVAQTLFCVGFPGLAYQHSDRMAAMLLASHLGGGMSSVLFQRIREQRGLAYTVYAYHDFYRDAGLFSVFLGTDRKNLRQAFDLIMAECRRSRKKKLSSLQLDEVKALVKGHLTIGLESTSSRMHRLGRQELVTGNYMSLEAALREIDGVTAADICRVSETIFDENRLTVAALGPSDPDQFSDIIP